MIKVQYTHVQKCHNESHCYAQFLYDNKIIYIFKAHSIIWYIYTVYNDNHNQLISTLITRQIGYIYFIELEKHVVH